MTENYMKGVRIQPWFESKIQKPYYARIAQELCACRILAETEKAWKLLIPCENFDIERWIPKSVCEMIN